MKILPTNAPPGAAERGRNGQRAHEELEAPRLIGDAVAGRPRRHVAQDDVVRREACELLVRERQRVALHEDGVGRQDHGQRLEVDGQQLPAVADLLGRVHRPAPGRGAEVEHAHARRAGGRTRRSISSSLKTLRAGNPASFAARVKRSGLA